MPQRRPRSHSNQAGLPAEPAALSWVEQSHRHRRIFHRCRRRPTEKHVHDLRITARRLLAQLEPPQPATARHERRRLKRLMRATARARDAQVQVRLLQRLTRGRRPAELEKFRRHLRRRARRFARKLARALGDDSLRPSPNPPSPPAATTRTGTALRGAFTRLNRRLGPARSRGDPEALHRARVAVKQFRYLAEATGAGRGQFAGMRALQAKLGELHDLDLFMARLETYAARHRRAALWLRRHRTALRGRRERLWRSLPPNPGRKGRA